MRSFLLASGNKHKAEEFQELFKGEIQVNPAPSTLEVQEDGKTFTENAFIKAKAYFDAYGVPTLADDSGLVVEALPGLLGVESARFAPELSTYPEKCLKLIDLLKNKENTNAYFVCVLCFYLSKDEVFFFEGRVQGNIGGSLKGNHGFGYDPIFIPDRQEKDGLTLAQLPAWKNLFSHRARAVQSSLQFFKDSIDKTTKKS